MSMFVKCVLMKVFVLPTLKELETHETFFRSMSKVSGKTQEKPEKTDL